MRQKDCLRVLNKWGPQNQKGPRLRRSFQLKEFVISHNDVKLFCVVIKIETEFLTSKCVKQGCPVFFRETIFDDVKVLEDRSREPITFNSMLRYF